MQFKTLLKPKLIYVFRINDTAHQGCLKVGEATCHEDNALGLPPNCKALNQAARERINQYTQTAGIAYELLYTELTLFVSDGHFCSFNDKEVHRVLLRSGIKRKVFDAANKANEWFLTDLETVKRAIAAVKAGKASLSPSEISAAQDPIVLRPEQRDAIDRTKKQFRKGSKQMLWNAKMRFGKTLSALQLAKELDFRRTLILTHRPVVDDGWFEDFGKIFFDCPGYAYGSKNKGEEHATLERRAKKKGFRYVYFASMQDLRGSEQVGGHFDKNDAVFSTPWDFIVVDEAHEGTETELGRAVMAELTKPATKVLRLSGTPFNLLDNYKEEEIYTWDYVMEQRAKEEWDKVHFGDPNPYAGLPKMNIYTYDLGRLLHEFVDEDVAFNFTEFFRVGGDGVFKHEEDVLAFLNLLSKEDEDSYYPYANNAYRNIFRHTLWVLPGVAAAKALKKMLECHPVFQHFQIVNVAGDGLREEESRDALKAVKNAIGDDPDQTSTITLSCGRLTTGVSVKAWTAVFMLSGGFATGASSYMQTIFRVQTPANINGRMKEECYVFDFAPDRTLRVLAETAKISSKAGNTSEGDRKAMGDFLNFCPVIGIEGSRMKLYDVPSMLQQLKRVYIERVINNGFEDNNLYNNIELSKLDEDALKYFQKLNKTIGATKAAPKTREIDINRQGLTDEEYEESEQLEKRNRKKDLTEEEKLLLAELREKKKNREKAISIMRSISIRMPLMIYGAEVQNETTDITLDNFAALIDPQSWEEFMPHGVTRQDFDTIKRYYDPDIFAAAAKRIRSIARAADRLGVEERIERITALFSTFRNPDKETVLTPWRVVNMHLADTLGGFCFFDEQYEQPLSEPRLVEHGEVTAQVFSPDSHVLEINSKTGLYPLYVAYSCYRSAVKSALLAPESVEEEQALWDKVVAQSVFVICKTPMAKSITRRTLVGFRPARVNTRYFEDLINQIKHKPDNFITKVRRGKSYWKANNNDNMKFDAIVGNPPYQVMDGGAGVSAIPVYNKFVEIAKAIKPSTISMIMPAKWYTDGKGLDAFRESMLRDSQIVKLVDFLDSRDCFSNVDIAGGICYFLWECGYIGKCEFVSKYRGDTHTSFRELHNEEVFVRYQEAIKIIAKINQYSSKFYNTKVSSRKPFGLATNVLPLGKGDIILKYNKGWGPYKSKLISTGREMIPKWKVIISRLTAEHAGQTDKEGKKRILSSLDILSPNEICTETYLVVDSCESESACKNVYKYMQSKFVRFLISLLASTQQMSKEKFRFVPIQDFTPPIPTSIGANQCLKLTASFMPNTTLRKKKWHLLSALLNPCDNGWQ